MWLSGRWKDYELIDCGSGEKLERWGDQLLVRPDPQAIWNTPRSHPGWKHNAGRYSRSSSGFSALGKEPEAWSRRRGKNRVWSISTSQAESMGVDLPF